MNPKPVSNAPFQTTPHSHHCIALTPSPNAHGGSVGRRRNPLYHLVANVLRRVNTERGKLPLRFFPVLGGGGLGWHEARKVALCLNLLSIHLRHANRSGAPHKDHLAISAISMASACGVSIPLPGASRSRKSPTSASMSETASFGIRNRKGYFVLPIDQY